MSIHLADRTIKYPKGLLENVDKMNFPANFLALEMEDAFILKALPLILGRLVMLRLGILVDIPMSTRHDMILVQV